jgi:hypothetical protein
LRLLRILREAQDYETLANCGDPLIVDEEGQVDHQDRYRQALAAAPADDAPEFLAPHERFTLAAGELLEDRALVSVNGSPMSAINKTSHANQLSPFSTLPSSFGSAKARRIVMRGFIARRPPLHDGR